MVRKAEHRGKIEELTTLEKIEKEKGKYAVITYHPRVYSNFKNIFKKYKLEPAPVNSHNFKTSFQNTTKDSIQAEDKSGIYEITCNKCEKVYVGQTRRKIKKRGQEHRRHATNREVDKSAVAKHVWEGHDVNFKPSLIKSIKKPWELNAWENLEMYKRKEKLMNTDLDGINNILFSVVKQKLADPESCATNTCAEREQGHSDTSPGQSVITDEGATRNRSE